MTIGGTQQQGYGTACRQADGTWKLVQQVPQEAPVIVAAPPQPRVVYVYPEPYYRPHPYYGAPYGFRPYPPPPYFGFGYGYGFGHGHRRHR